MEGFEFPQKEKHIKRLKKYYFRTKNGFSISTSAHKTKISVAVTHAQKT